jgi:glycosyl-4,4'-diaponeurosporenoate acyltransferase
MRIVELPAIWTVITDFIAWFIIHMAVALFTLKLPDRFFSHDSWLYRSHAWEKSGQVWQKVFKVKYWKERLPDGAAIIGKGFVKKNLQNNDAEFLMRFVLESRRAELTHWLAMAPAVLFFLWNPVWVGIIMIIYAVFANAPCIIAQRYNRPRFLRTASRAMARESTTASSQPSRGLTQ